MVILLNIENIKSDCKYLDVVDNEVKVQSVIQPWLDTPHNRRLRKDPRLSFTNRKNIKLALKESSSMSLDIQTQIEKSRYINEGESIEDCVLRHKQDSNYLIIVENVNIKKQLHNRKPEIQGNKPQK